jgi:ADP-ribose pyrophosphatase YjhB (NUDIX family)
MTESPSIRIRVCLAVVQEKKILLVPHYHTDVGPLQWVIPGGAVEFGEKLQTAAIREFRGETGLQAECDEMLDIYENVQPDRPWHSITIAFLGKVIGGKITPEITDYGEKIPQWFSLEELSSLKYHPPQIVEKAFRYYDLSHS